MTSLNETSRTDAAVDWEHELGELLALLSTTQGELLALLGEKRELLVKADVEGLAAIAPREEAVVAQLQVCQLRREELLERAAADGLPADSLQSLSAALPGRLSRELKQSMDAAQQRTRLLRHHSLTNWVLVQRTLLHLSQMLEIIATGGQPRTTYGKGSASAGGSLVDQAA